MAPLGVAVVRILSDHMRSQFQTELAMILLRKTLPVTLFLAIASASLVADERDNPQKAIEKANAAFTVAYGKGDAKLLAEMYTEKAQLFPPHQEVVDGRPAIEKFWKGVMDAGIVGVELKTTEVESFGDSIVESGKATLLGKDGAVLDK